MPLSRATADTGRNTEWGGSAQGSRRRGGTTPWPHPLQTKVIIMGTNKVYNGENLVGPFVVHKLLGRVPPPLLLPWIRPRHADPPRDALRSTLVTMDAAPALKLVPTHARPWTPAPERATFPPTPARNGHQMTPPPRGGGGRARGPKPDRSTTTRLCPEETFYSAPLALWTSGASDPRRNPGYCTCAQAAVIQSAERKLAHQWPTRPQVSFCHKE